VTSLEMERDRRRSRVMDPPLVRSCIRLPDQPTTGQALVLVESLFGCRDTLNETAARWRTTFVSGSGPVRSDSLVVSQGLNGERGGGQPNRSGGHGPRPCSRRRW
jgi:hypothetical protein